MAKWFGRRPYTLPRHGPIITFTFDDFPRSALHVAGEMLESAGAAGTYFTSLGLASQCTPTGTMFEPDDLVRVVTRGHELGCHTFHHCAAWETASQRYLDSVIQNSIQLASGPQSGTSQFLTHSYPISYPRPRTKTLISNRFLGARGGGQTFNHGKVDLNYLNSFFIEQSRDDFPQIERTIAATVNAGGWLIFSTHDVCDHPTRYGCVPSLFARILQASVRSGAEILAMSAALRVLRAGTQPARNA